MVQKLTAHTAPKEGLLPHQVAHSYMKLQLQGLQHHLLLSAGTSTHVHIFLQNQNHACM